MAGVTGFEPATSGAHVSQRSTAELHSVTTLRDCIIAYSILGKLKHHTKLCTASLLAMYNVPYRKLRPISTPWLNALQRLHLVPINLIISQGT